VYHRRYRALITAALSDHSEALSKGRCVNRIHRRARRHGRGTGRVRPPGRLVLIDVLEKTGLAIGRRIADLCTGSGVVAITAAALGASAVTAFDICPRAVRCARVNAVCAGVDVDVHLGSWARAVEFAPFDLVVCNPPYVPHDPRVNNALPATIGPARAWHAGYDERLVLDPVCEAVPDLLADRGSLRLVQSEFADPRRTLAALSSAGLDAKMVARQC